MEWYKNIYGKYILWVENIDFFKKSFKAHTGVSPAEYRRKGAGEGTVGRARQRNDRNGE